MEMKISQPFFGILVVLTKNELTKICNELGINEQKECAILIIKTQLLLLKSIFSNVNNNNDVNEFPFLISW